MTAAAPARAAWYAVLVDGGERWAELREGFLNRDEAIEAAREQLRQRRSRAAVVQGRGTPEHPTPAGEVTAWRGVQHGFRVEAFFAVPLGVEVVR